MTEQAQALPPRAPIHDAIQLPPGLIKANPWNRKIDEKRLADLAASVRLHGVLQPVLVRPIEGAKRGEPLYELIAGERRWRACQMAEVALLPALVRPMDDLQVIELMLIENLEREDLHPLDEALGYDRLLRKDSGPQALRGFETIDALAERIGKSRSYVIQRLTLLKLCSTGVEAFRDGRLSFSLALRIARLPHAVDQAEATKHIAAGWGGSPLSARDADEYIQREFMLDLSRAVFKITDEGLVPEAGSCRACSKRTGSNPDLFDDIKRGDTCTDGTCYQAKADAHRTALKDAAEAKGMEVVSGDQAKKLMPHKYGDDAKGLMALDKVHYSIDANKPLRKLLAKSGVKPVLFENPHTKDLVEMVPQAEALAALKAAGVIKTERLPGSAAATRDANAKQKQEQAWRTEVASACVQAAKGELGAGPDYRAQLIQRVAVQLWHEMHNDTRARLVKLLGWPPLKARWDDGPGVTADEHINALGDADLCAYLTAATIVGETIMPSYSAVQAPTRLLAAAADLAVDAAAIKDSLRKPERVAKPKKSAKPATTPETALAQAMKAAKPAKPGKGPAIKYRCPATLQTWTGRGLMPKWLKVATSLGGRTLDEFLIDKPAATAASTTQAAAAAATTEEATHA